MKAGVGSRDCLSYKHKEQPMTTKIWLTEDATFVASPTYLEVPIADSSFSPADESVKIQPKRYRQEWPVLTTGVSAQLTALASFRRAHLSETQGDASRM